MAAFKQDQTQPLIQQHFRRDLLRLRGGMPPPPPAPPPPPPLHVSTSFLPSGGRSSAYSNRETRYTVPPPSKSSTPGLDAQTLQCAAAGLRKTQYDRPLRSDFESLPNGRMDGSNQHLPGRYWQDRPFNESMESNKTRETFHASPSGARVAMPLGNVYRYPDSLNYEATERPMQSSYSSSSYQQYSSYEQPKNSSVSARDSPYISDPRAAIRVYATQTPAYTLMKPQHHIESYRQDYTYNSSTGPRKRVDEGIKFARELRDQGLTRSQRIANQFQQSHLRDVPPPPSLNTLYQQTRRQGGDQIDSLIRDMEWKMKTGVGAAGDNNCCKCGEGISNDRPGCTALDQMFHVACFTCKECGKQLAGASFYNVDGKPLCEQDYKNSLERCVSCGEPIMNKLLRASGSTYHPACFVCSVCKKCLDGVPFTVDSANSIHCVDCFHQKFAPRCAVCSQPIVPEEGEKESVRVIAMDKSFHVNCYRCEDCNMQLSSKLDGQGCYPLDQHLYCKTCNGKRLIALSRTA